MGVPSFTNGLPSQSKRDQSANELRILILSTPKTGNTWLSNLLAAMYELPKLGLVCPFDYRQALSLGKRWIVFHHFEPERALLDWIDEVKPFLLTTVRHPGDVLLSLYHHIHDFPSSPVDQGELQAMLEGPFERRAIFPPATHTFSDELECSLAWKRTGQTKTVRYEDLRLDTFGTLSALADEIDPLEPARIEQAIERCDIRLMRSLDEENKRFFRSGEVGQWRRILGPGILDCLAAEPYRSQLAQLEYTLDSEEEMVTRTLQVRRPANPFRTLRSFANGVAVAPIIEAFYFSLDPAINTQWPPLANVGSQSFFEWINGPCEIDGQGLYAEIFITRLAYFLYRSRPDLERAFPALTGPDRAKYAEWFTRYAGNSDHKLDPQFIAPVKNTLVRWGNARFAGDRVRRLWWPKLTNFAVQVHGSLPALQRHFPDYLNKHRWGLLYWIVASEHGGENLRELRDPIGADLSKCMKYRSLLSLFQR